jgi:valyl-tRNA synthetase
MPFLTEELWHAFGFGAEGTSILEASWPLENESQLRALAEPNVRYVDGKHELIRAGRTLRGDYQIPPAQKIDFVIKPADPGEAEAYRADIDGMAVLLKAGSVTIDPDFMPSGPMPSLLGERGAVFMSMAGLDLAAEKQRLTGEREQAEQSLARTRAMLGNEKFMAKAKPEVVEGTRAQEAMLVEKIDKLNRLIAAM